MERSVETVAGYFRPFAYHDERMCGERGLSYRSCFVHCCNEHRSVCHTGIFLNRYLCSTRCQCILLSATSQSYFSELLLRATSQSYFYGQGRNTRSAGEGLRVESHFVCS